MKKFKDRYIIFAIFFIIFGIIIISFQAGLQVVNGDEYDREAQRRLLKEQKVSAPRGNIIDRNGIPAAVNRESSTVNITYIKMDRYKRDAMFLDLVRLFEKNRDEYRDSFKDYIVCNPGSENMFTYGSLLNDEAALEKWKKEMAVRQSDIGEMADPETIFEYMRKKKFNIDDVYTDEEAYKIILIRYEILIYQYANCNPLAADVSRQTVAELEERHDEFPGITTGIGYMRQYIDGSIIAHVLGYLGSISEEKLVQLKEQGYNMDDRIGITGIEYSAEQYLKGKDGINQAAQETSSEIGMMGYIDPENIMQPGNDVVLTIDLYLQKAAMRSLAERIEQIRTWPDPQNYGDARAGSAVVIDVRSGEILAMASYPSYDPSAFLADANDAEAGQLISGWLNDASGLNPMFNRAIQGAYAPGSTFKMLTGIAGVEEGRITGQTVFNDTGTWSLSPADGGKTFYCLEYRSWGWSHGMLDLREAITTSCNLYFQWLGYLTGIDNMNKWARYFGLGSKTGIDIPGEVTGILASRESQRLYRNDIWRPADTCIAAIGQHDNLFTPLQLANYIAAIANGGKLYTPYLIKRVIKYDGIIVEEKKPSYTDIPVSGETLDLITEGMVDVTITVEGTANEAFKGTSYIIAGKTGTAETSDVNHSSNAVFVCFAPADKPEVAVAVVIERGVWGSYAAFVARDILNEYFGTGVNAASDKAIVTDTPVFTR